jgi:hypothetical protein
MGCMPKAAKTMQAATREKVQECAWQAKARGKDMGRAGRRRRGRDGAGWGGMAQGRTSVSTASLPAADALPFPLATILEKSLVKNKKNSPPLFHAVPRQQESRSVFTEGLPVFLLFLFFVRQNPMNSCFSACKMQMSLENV